MRRVILAVPEKPEEHDELDDTYVSRPTRNFKLLSWKETPVLQIPNF